MSRHPIGIPALQRMDAAHHLHPFSDHALLERAGVPLRLFRPLQMNSDHGNFARAGIPAFRLVAGFGEPDAAARATSSPWP